MDVLAPLISALREEGRPRVWSLIITIFGDSIQHRGGAVATVRLARLLGRIGIEQGTVRTALSRLSGDGWVTSSRQGRTSSYRLSPRGVAEYTSATPAIYAPPSSEPVTLWSLSQGGTRPGFAIGDFLLRPADGQHDGTFQIDGTLSAMSPDQRSKLIGPDHLVALSKMQADLAHIDGQVLPPLDALAARTLLLHRWRRLILKFPEAPVEFMPPQLECVNMRAEMARAYHQISPAAETWLSLSEGEMPALPAPQPHWQTRFTNT